MCHVWIRDYSKWEGYAVCSVCMYGRVVKVISFLAVSGGTVSVRGSGSVVYNLTITQAATLVRL